MANNNKQNSNQQSINDLLPVYAGDKPGGLLTPENSVICICDHQPLVAFPVASIDRESLVNNVVALVKVAKAFDVPLVLTTIKANLSGPLFGEILAAAPGVEVIDRAAKRNAFADETFRAAVEKTGRRKFIIAGLWTEVCLAFSSLSAIDAGYDVYPVVDASGGTSKEAHDTAVMRMVQAGAHPITWLQLEREFLDVTTAPETSAKVREIDKQHAGALGLTWEYEEFIQVQQHPETAGSGR